MNQIESGTGHEAASTLREVAQRLRFDLGAWSEVLCAWVQGLEAALAIKDLSTGRYVHASAKLAELFGRPINDILGRTDADLLGADTAAPMRAADLTTATLGTPHSTEHRIERDRLRRDFQVTRVVLKGSDTPPQRYLCALWIEVSAKRQREAQLGLALKQLEQQQVAHEALRRETQDVALRDAVTGLYQTVHFEDQLRREVDLSSREHREFSLVAISLDAPLAAAAALGAAARQRVVESLGQLLRGNTRAMDASCRTSEDRFAVLLSGVGLATAHARMEGLRRQCATQIVVLDGRDFGFTVSMGVASFPHTAHTREELLQAAEVALASAQARGGNLVALASIRFDAGV